MPFHNLGVISKGVSSLLSPVLQEKINKLVPLAKAQLGGAPSGGVALGSIKLMVNLHFNDLPPAQINALTLQTLLGIIHSESQGIFNQVTALEQAGASEEAIKNVIQGSQMEFLKKAFELQSSINKSMHEMQMNIITNLGR